MNNISAENKKIIKEIVLKLIKTNEEFRLTNTIYDSAYTAILLASVLSISLLRSRSTNLYFIFCSDLISFTKYSRDSKT